MAWFGRSKEDALILDEEMDWLTSEILDVAFSRRRFLGIMAGAAAMAIWPFEIKASEPDYITVTVSRDKKRNSLGAIVENYCDAETLLRFYDTTEISVAIRKLAKFNGIKDPNKIFIGQKIKIPRTVLKRDIRKAAKEELDRKELKGSGAYGPQNKAGFQSPFGGAVKPKVHLCFQGTPQNARGKRARICPFDRYTAKRSGGRDHAALDIWGKIGTKLYPLKPGKVVGAGVYYLNSDGKRVKFKFRKNNGNAVKIQTEDGFTFMYIHLKEVFVNLGDRVDYDTSVGTLGVTGNASKANPHVHITMNKNGKRVDPFKYLKFLE